MTDNFAIVNIRDGVRKDVESFLVDNDSFPILENSYLFRGRIERRSCFSAVGTDGRLKSSVTGVTDGAGAFSVTYLDGTVGTGIPAGVASFRITGVKSGSPVSVTLTDPGGASPVALLTTNALITGTLTRGTGVLAIAGLDAGTAITVVYVPGLPVMGLKTLEQDALNDELLMAFDTRYSYLFDTGSNDFIIENFFTTAANKFVWTGTDSDLFWSTNYRSAFWATNNVAGKHAAEDASPVAEGDGIRWYGTIAGPNTGWVNFNPPITAANFLLGALIILPYKDRLVVLNTQEGPNLAGSVRKAQRARWSQNGTPFYGLFPINQTAQADSWRDDIVGKGGFIDAPTQEAIVSAEFIKDTLIVYFERSTWQLVYTGNETLPFVWQKINTELGSESTFSIVPFDRGAFAIGNYGIITTDSVNVVRIDQKIPDQVFQIQNLNNGVKRVSGIRDYNAQLVYFSYPIRVDDVGDSVNYDLTFPNQVLVYNYLDGSWATFDDCFTCFGYWQKFSDVTWAQLPVSWESTQSAWNSGVLQGRYPDVIAGNQRGFVLVFSQLQLNGQNVPSIPVSNITPATYTISAPDHNFVNDDYIMITGQQGIVSTNSSGTPNNIIYKVASATVSTFVCVPVDPTLDVWSGTYTGGGVITHIPNIYIRTKEFNPYFENAKSFRINYLDIYLDRTSSGQFTGQFYTSDNTSTAIDVKTISTAPEVMPTYTTPSANYQLTQNKIWHRIYTNSFGSFIQNVFTLNDTQMRDLNIATSDITIQGIIYNISEAGRISYDI
jgi:hypothetical protein